MSRKPTNPFTVRVAASGLTLRDLSFFTTISENRLRAYAQGRLADGLTPIEHEAIGQAIASHRVLIHRKLEVAEQIRLTLREAPTKAGV